MACWFNPHPFRRLYNQRRSKGLYLVSHVPCIFQLNHPKREFHYATCAKIRRLRQPLHTRSSPPANQPSPAQPARDWTKKEKSRRGSVGGGSTPGIDIVMRRQLRTYSSTVLYTHHTHTRVVEYSTLHTHNSPIPCRSSWGKL